MQESDDRLYTVNDLRSYLRVSRSTVYELVAAGLEPTYRIGVSPRWTHGSVVSFLKTHAKPALFVAASLK